MGMPGFYPVGTPASMRPGQSCPGVESRGRRRHGLSLVLGFNEAGAIMPRSGFRRLRLLIRPQPSFNEAGAIMPRSGRMYAVTSFG